MVLRDEAAQHPGARRAQGFQAIGPRPLQRLDGRRQANRTGDGLRHFLGTRVDVVRHQPVQDARDGAPRSGAAERRVHRHVALGIEAHGAVADVG